MDQETPEHDRFTPRRPASQVRLILAFVFGPVAWVVALLIASWLIDRTDAIEIGVLVTVTSAAVAFVILSLLRWSRGREERRYVRSAR
jgi:hypothetical protein